MYIFDHNFYQVQFLKINFKSLKQLIATSKLSVNNQMHLIVKH